MLIPLSACNIELFQNVGTELSSQTIILLNIYYKL